eukprot:SAG31_NODE_35474_length_322_cov_1.578475_1_plen_58_part_01
MTVSRSIWLAAHSEMVKRQRDARGPSYPPYVVGEPVAGNYYPVNGSQHFDLVVLTEAL